MGAIIWIILLGIFVAVFGGLILIGSAIALWYAFIGIVVGGIGRLLVPGTGNVGMLATLLAGIGGALIGGGIAHTTDIGWLGEFVVAVLAAAVLTAIVVASSRNSSHTDHRELT